MSTQLTSSTFERGRFSAATEGKDAECATVIKLADGHITEQTVVQAWDES
jgi:hypothetical protein